MITTFFGLLAVILVVVGGLVVLVAPVVYFIEKLARRDVSFIVPVAVMFAYVAVVAAVILTILGYHARF